MDKKHIVVTGGAGFIGSHLCASLLKKGHTVLCFDSLVTGKKRNIEGLLKERNFSFIQGDVRDISPGRHPFGSLIHQVYDLASPASVTYVTEHPIEAATVNALGTKNLLDIAVDNHARLLFASSSEVYGDPKEHPQKESYWGNVNPVGLRSGYDEGKRFGETLVTAYRREHNLQVRIARIFNTYGPYSDPNDSRVIPSFVTKALRGEPLTVHGDGTQTRSFCYVSDMVSGLIQLMESGETGPINLGNPEEYTIVAIAKKVIALTDSCLSITFVARPSDDPAVRKPDIKLARQKLGWQPMVTLDDGLRKTIEYFQNLL